MEHSKETLFRLLITTLLSLLTLGILYALVQLGDINVAIESVTVRASGVVGAFVLIFLMTSRVVFPRQETPGKVEEYVKDIKGKIRGRR